MLSNRVYGAKLDIQPSDEPSLVVSVTQISTDPALTVGSPVAAGTSKIGTVVDLSASSGRRSPGTQDAGNNVSLAVHPAATLRLPSPAPVGAR